MWTSSSVPASISAAVSVPGADPPYLAYASWSVRPAPLTVAGRGATAAAAALKDEGEEGEKGAALAAAGLLAGELASAKEEG